MKEHLAFEFNILFSVADVVPTIPHSNARGKRVLSSRDSL